MTKNTKKRIASHSILLIMSILFTIPVSAGSLDVDKARFETLYNASKINEVLAHHSSSLDECHIFFQDELIGSKYLYAEETLQCVLSSDGIAYLDTFEQSVLAGDVYPGNYCTYIADKKDTYRIWFEKDTVDFDPMPLESQSFYASEEKEGCFIAYTEIKDEETVSEIIEGMAASYGGYEYQDGLTLRVRYVYDLATNVELSSEIWIVETDGTEHLFTQEYFTYDAAFDYAREGSPLHDYFHAEEEKARTISVTFGSGTEDEIIRECTVPQGTGFLVYKDGQAVEEFFSDPACTQPYGGSDGIVDLQLYVR